MTLGARLARTTITNCYETPSQIHFSNPPFGLDFIESRLLLQCEFQLPPSAPGLIQNDDRFRSGRPVVAAVTVSDRRGRIQGQAILILRA